MLADWVRMCLCVYVNVCLDGSADQSKYIPISETKRHSPQVCASEWACSVVFIRAPNAQYITYFGVIANNFANSHSFATTSWCWPCGVVECDCDCDSIAIYTIYTLTRAQRISPATTMPIISSCDLDSACARVVMLRSAMCACVCMLSICVNAIIKHLIGGAMPRSRRMRIRERERAAARFPFIRNSNRAKSSMFTQSIASSSSSSSLPSRYDLHFPRRRFHTKSTLFSKTHSHIDIHTRNMDSHLNYTLFYSNTSICNCVLLKFGLGFLECKFKWVTRRIRKISHLPVALMWINFVSHGTPAEHDFS